MQTSELLYNQGNKTIELADGIFRGMHVLIVRPENKLPSNLCDFFDVIICEGSHEQSTIPDIWISADRELAKYTLFRQEKRTLYATIEALYCIEMSAALLAKRSKLNLAFPALVYGHIIGQCSNQPLLYNKISCGISSVAPGVHLAHIGKAAKVFSTYPSEHSITLDDERLNVYVTEKRTGYVPIPANIRCPNRKAFIQTVTWWNK